MIGSVISKSDMSVTYLTFPRYRILNLLDRAWLPFLLQAKKCPLMQKHANAASGGLLNLFQSSRKDFQPAVWKDSTVRRQEMVFSLEKPFSRIIR